MNKTIMIIISTSVIIFGIITASIIVKTKQNENSEVIETKIAKEKVTDECTEEYEEFKNETLVTNTKEERISPNAFIILKKHYKKCGHIISKYVETSENLVNMTKEELQKEYGEVNISEFSDAEIIIEKQEEGECGEHYIVKDKGGKVTIYKILENGKEQEYEVTDISIEYLTDTDKENMQKGVRINSKEELNQFIENFE